MIRTAVAFTVLVLGFLSAPAGGTADADIEGPEKIVGSPDVRQQLLDRGFVATGSVLYAGDASPRVRFGAERLAAAIQSTGSSGAVNSEKGVAEASTIVVGTLGASAALEKLIGGDHLKAATDGLGPEGFVLKSIRTGIIAVVGVDDSGTLYGCLELVRRLRALGKLPASIDFADAPMFRLRGPCIGMQKTYILPGYGQYNYPYTPKLFPFFYDKSHWTRLLNLLVENRMNSLTLWNGHPFSSLVRLDEYPEALDVSEEVFAKNQEMFRWLANECDKRGIWLVQMFYNIHLSKRLADRRGISTHQASPNEFLSDYTRKSIARFIEEFPNVGLLVCLGEALQTGKDRWLRDVIIGGVKDGMQKAGLKQQPPIIIREHTMQAAAPAIIGAGLEQYDNLYTMMKYNGESLTTYQPRGPWAEVHRALSALAPNHISNVHILANLEPFRYGATRFIQKCVQAMRDVHHCNGLHLYPLAYWDWPHSPDKAEPKLLQMERDELWYAAWARYAWGPDRDPEDEDAYWTERLADRYGSEAAGHILEAYNEAGLCAPKILRRFGITNGNRQTLSLGMTLDQLMHPKKYRVWPRLVDSDGPPGERLPEFVEKEVKNEPHQGETPPKVIEEVLASSQKAVKEIERAATYVTRNREEFGRLRNDIHCIRAMSECYAYKAQAAMKALRYEHTKEPADMRKALEWLEKSLEAYHRLTRLTESRYRYANSLQTGTRKVPFTGSDGKYDHWTDCLPVYEKELEEFRARVQGLAAGGPANLRETKAGR